MQNGFCESFNGRTRDELLNETLFFGLDHARTTIAEWADDYNRSRPHSALGYITPAAYAANLTATGDRLRNPDQLRRSPVAQPAPYGVQPAEALICQVMPFSCAQASMAFEVNSVPWSETIMLGLPRWAINSVSSRATRRPEIEVSGIAARHSRVTSSTTLRMRKRRPQANWSWTKSSDQRAFGLASTRIGARVPTARRRDRHLRTVSPSSR